MGGVDERPEERRLILSSGRLLLAVCDGDEGADLLLLEIE
jgi:hypothetical protein